MAVHKLLYGSEWWTLMQKDFKGYVAENILLKVVPEFYLLSDKL
jgi:hypothetical protein